jgi:hypothetical protein
VHEHWNNATAKQYSRNLDPVNGTGIELMALTASREAVISISHAQGQCVLSWLASLGYDLQTTTNLAVSNAWSKVSPLPPAFQGRNWLTNDGSDPSRFYRLSR